MPKVSVIMPVYNSDKYIHDSIKSVLSQTYTDFELILVDDGSTDKCPQICDKYSESYNNITVIHKQNGGQSSARNIGVERASGKYILFVDSDDTIDHETLEKTVLKAEETDADIIIFGMHIISVSNGSISGESFKKHKSAFLSNRDEVEKNFVMMNEELMWNHPVDKLFKKSIITENNVVSDSFYDKVCEDTVFLLDLFPFVNSILIMEDCFYNYTIRDNQSVVSSYFPERYQKLYGRFCKTKTVLDLLKNEYQDYNLLFDMYCKFIVWSYEFLFHRKCKLSVLGRYKNIRDTFKIRKENKRFCIEAEKYFFSTEYSNGLSHTTKKVLHYILHKKYLLAWIYHIISLKRNNKNA